MFAIKEASAFFDNHRGVYSSVSVLEPCLGSSMSVAYLRRASLF
jgi:hypothetical protein